VALRVLRHLDGTRLFPFDYDGNGQRDDLAGDFDADGRVDVGGPDVPYYTLGMSMGGINSTILGTVDPTLVAVAPVSMGGGLYEVGMRTTLGNVRNAGLMPLGDPSIITQPLNDDPGVVTHGLGLVRFLVSDIFDYEIYNIAVVGDLDGTVPVDELRAGDTMFLENLDNGEVASMVIPADRRTRITVPSDYGDRLRLTFARPDGAHYATVDELQERFFFRGKEYDVGAPLTAIREGMGLTRNTPELRRLLAISQMVLDPGDPVNYVPFYQTPLDIAPEGAHAVNPLFVITMGDSTVPVATGVSVARAAGVIDYTNTNTPWGVTQNQLLIDTHVTESVNVLRYFENDSCRKDARAANFDIDDLSNGLHPEGPPRLTAVCTGAHACVDDCSGASPPAPCSPDCQPLPPLRATVHRPGGGILAARIPAFELEGQHVISLFEPGSPFDATMFTANQMGLFLSSGGTILSDHPCLARNDCRACVPEHGQPCPNIPAPTTVPRD
jgi:hypothetical protein